ncbi:MAG: hypothetical protein HYR94_28015, partial [Chloroflexi bacterium]|nr:hypothetical protein [Chloroflexota bacterium]
ETLAAKQQSSERIDHFADFESVLETLPAPITDPAELSDETIQAEVDAVRAAPLCSERSLIPTCWYGWRRASQPLRH